MKIIEIRAMRGPNYWSVKYHHLVVMKLDLEELEYQSTNEIAGFSERIEKLLPSLYNHYCSEGHPGGFFERVKDGTWMGHVIEHIALEIQTLAGMNCGFGRTRSTGQEGIYNVVIEYQVEEAGRYAAEAAVRIAQALIEDTPCNVETIIDKLKQIQKEHFPGPSTHAILEAARRRNIPILSVSPHDLYQLGYGTRQRRIRASIASTTSCLAVDIAGDKDETKYLLKEAGIPVPQGTIVKSQVELKGAIAQIGFPLVIKPSDGHQGKGITVGIKTIEEAEEALELAQSFSDKVIVEQCIGGHDFRLLVVNYRFVAATRRRAAAITGDGQSTISQLVSKINQDPKRGDGYESSLTAIKIDAVTESMLDEKGLTLDTVLPEGEILYLKRTANLSTGGTAMDVTDHIDPANIRLAERIARTIGLDICGIDVTAPGIDTPIITNGGAVLEVNAAPGLRMHVAPSEGISRDVGTAIVDMLFPAGATGRIPIVAVTGTNGKTTVSRLIAHIVKVGGYRTGLTTTDGIYVNGELIQPGDNTGPVSTQLVLKEKDVDFAVLECARGGLLRSGLGFDQCDVGVVTNVAADHLGLGGIDTVEQMAKVKAVIPESVKPDGLAILNAEDDLVYAMHERVRCRVAYFSLHPHHERIIAHCISGGLAAVLKEDTIMLYDGGNQIEVAKIADAPATFDGKASYMIQNVLAATLAAYASRIDPREIRRGLQTFDTSPENTPGRMNMFAFKQFRFMVDYAHNPAALRALGDFLQHLEDTSKVGIITGVGDRRDEDIIETGKIAAQVFDEVVIRFDQDLRGRTTDEIAALLMQGIRQVDADKLIRIFPTEEEAITQTIRSARPGALLVNCTEKVKESLAIVQRLLSQEPASSVASDSGQGASLATTDVVSASPLGQ